MRLLLSDLLILIYFSVQTSEMLLDQSHLVHLLWSALRTAFTERRRIVFTSTSSPRTFVSHKMETLDSKDPGQTWEELHSSLLLFSCQDWIQKAELQLLEVRTWWERTLSWWQLSTEEVCLGVGDGRILANQSIVVGGMEYSDWTRATELYFLSNQSVSLL